MITLSESKKKQKSSPCQETLSGRTSLGWRTKVLPLFALNYVRFKFEMMNPGLILSY